VFVDHQLRVLRFTPAASQIINLILTDVGRPVSHIVSNLVGYDRLVADTQEMLHTLIPKEVEVQTTSGQWYKMRIQAYRTLDNVIEGAVISFFDISALVKLRDDLRHSNDLQRLGVALRGQALATLAQLSQAKVLEPYRSQRLTQAGAVVEVSMVSTALLNEAGQMYAIATTERALAHAD